jgi:hypothetical protein
VTEGPFTVGDHVVVFNEEGNRIIDRGVIDGEHLPANDGTDEYAYDVSGNLHRHDGVSEVLLDWDMSA